MPPAIAVIVHDLAHAYERALVDGDGEAAASFFADVDHVSRFGPEGAQRGPQEVRALRKGYAAVAPPEWLVDEVVVLGDDVAIHKAVMLRGDAVLQRTQVWQDVDGWRIVHAHVSRVAAR